MDKYQEALNWIKYELSESYATDEWFKKKNECIQLMQELVKENTIETKENTIETKEDAIIDLQNLKSIYANNTYNQHYFKTFDIAIECIQRCIDEEDSPCYDCDHSYCDNCLYGGRILG